MNYQIVVPKVFNYWVSNGNTVACTSEAILAAFIFCDSSLLPDPYTNWKDAKKRLGSWMEDIGEVQARILEKCGVDPYADYPDIDPAWKQVLFLEWARGYKERMGEHPVTSEY